MVNLHMHCYPHGLWHPFCVCHWLVWVGSVGGIWCGDYWMKCGFDFKSQHLCNLSEPHIPPPRTSSKHKIWAPTPAFSIVFNESLAGFSGWGNCTCAHTCTWYLLVCLCCVIWLHESKKKKWRTTTARHSWGTWQCASLKNFEVVWILMYGRLNVYSLCRKHSMLQSKTRGFFFLFI